MAPKGQLRSAHEGLCWSGLAAVEEASGEEDDGDHEGEAGV
jgi:hypothetical protein